MSARLNEADVRVQLRNLKRRHGVSQPIALFGHGEGGELSVDGERWRVLPVRSELELRGALVEAELDARLPIALLVDYSERLPLDLACRLAGQRVHALEKRARLANLFGARRVAPGVLGNPLVEILLDEQPPDLVPIRGTVLQMDDAWPRYLAVRLGLAPEQVPTLAELLTRGLEQPERGQDFRRRRADLAWRAALDEAERWMEQKLGPAGHQAWRAWLSGDTVDLIAWAVNVDAARRSGHAGALGVLRIALRYGRGDASLLDERVAAPLCEAVCALLEAMDDARRAPLLRRAGAIFDDPDFGPARRLSAWLPDGLTALEDELAGALGGPPEDLDALARAVSLVERLGQHGLVRTSAAATRRYEVALAGVRLAAWLAWLERKPLHDGVGASSMGVLAAWHDEQGGWVDLARAELRQHSTGNSRLDGALRALLVAVDRVRRQLDRRFAEALVAWHEQDKPGSSAMPIEDVTKRVLAPFLREQPTRRVLVILMDGMSTAVATQIVDGLSEWSPIGWISPGSRGLPPAIAVLPTLTNTSRAAFFAGKAAHRHGDEGVDLDPERWASNPALRDLGGSDAGPRLFLKGSLTAQGELQPELVRALADESERVVAVVVNAVDDALGAGDQVSLSYDHPATIPVLQRLLRAAWTSQRVVMLTSDHGHIPATTLSGASLPEGSTPINARLRGLGPGQRPLDGEIRLPDRCWKPRGVREVALLWDESRRWSSSAKGAHGGASLAEVVVPVRLLATHWMRDSGGVIDEGLRTVSLHRPAWWKLAIPAPREAAPPPRAETRQLSLLTPAAAPPPAPPRPPPRPDPAGDGHALTQALKRSKLFEEHTAGQPQDRIDRALEFVDALLKAPGYQLPLGAFATRVGAAPRRLEGYVAQLGFLNADGFTILELDSPGQQMRLHRDRLISQYGLKES